MYGSCMRWRIDPRRECKNEFWDTEDFIISKVINWEVSNTAHIEQRIWPRWWWWCKNFDKVSPLELMVSINKVKRTWVWRLIQMHFDCILCHCSLDKWFMWPLIYLHNRVELHIWTYRKEMYLEIIQLEIDGAETTMYHYHVACYTWSSQQVWVMDHHGTRPFPSVVESKIKDT